MRVFLATEFKCIIYEKEYYLNVRAYTIFVRYAKYFGDIVLCSRFEEVEEEPFDCIKADFIKEVVKCNSLEKCMLGLCKDKIINMMKLCDLVVGRFPSIIAFMTHDYAKKIGKIFVAELMCDAWDSYWNHSFMGKIIAPYMTVKMKKCTWDADFAIYVTKKFLQKRYPCRNSRLNNASNVVIINTDADILIRRLKRIRNTDLYNISMMTSADVDQRSKGQEYMVKALKILKKKFINVTYYLVGGGNQSYLTKIAQRNGVVENLIFMGRLPIEKVFEKLDEIDIYIQPSLQEGLPRAVIEAMSRACPVIGARTAGIPELIDDECVFERRSEKSIAKAVETVLNNGLDRYAIRNFEYSKSYHDNILNDRRNSYFKEIKDMVNNKNKERCNACREKSIL